MYTSPGVVSFDKLEVHSFCNTADDTILRNVEINAGRDLPWVTGMSPVRPGNLVIVCGGPSLRKSVDAIASHKSDGDYIVCVNHTAQWLIERGVRPDALILLDADPQVIECRVDGLDYYIASQCDPSVFDGLASENIVLWHSATDGIEDAVSRGAPQRAGEQYACIGGGVTVGLRALNLFYVLGWRSFDVYGMDSSFEGEGHAYQKDWQDNDPMMRVEAFGRTFIVEPWMAAQAKYYQPLKELMRANGADVRAHGGGLIPWLDKNP